MFDNSLLPEKTSQLIPYCPDKNYYNIRLDANESNYSLPEKVRMKLSEIVMSADFNRYPDPDAEKLIDAFSNYYRINSDFVASANGSDELLALIMNTFLTKGDKILTFYPDFSMYEFYASLSELSIVSQNKIADNFSVDFSLADKAIKEKGIKLCIFSNPCNPTGRLEKKSDIEKLVLGNKNTIFIVDEAYMDFTNQSESFLKFTSDYRNLIVLKTLSKAFGAASLRLGFAVGDKVTASAFKKVKSPYNVGGLSQKFGEALLLEKELMNEQTITIISDTEYLVSSLSKQNYKDFTLFPTSANFMMIKTPFADLIQSELKKKSIAIRKFKIFVDNYLRISAGKKEETDTLVYEISEILKIRELDYEKSTNKQKYS